jgi:TetR/AcrR family transcriptional regulator, cholesterol catabolism regulator
MTESTTSIGRAHQPGRKRRRRKRARNVDPKASTRVEILKSAAAAFRRLGYHGATVEQIAAVLHMKKGNLYYYFKNKEEILFACHQYSLDQLMTLMHEIRHSGLRADEKLRRLIDAFVHTILDELHGTALFLDLEALSPAHLKAVIARRDEFEHGVRQVLEEGMRDGTFGRGDPKLLAFALFGAVNWIPRWFNPDGTASSKTIADVFADFFVAGLRRGSV